MRRAPSDLGREVRYGVEPESRYAIVEDALEPVQGYIARVGVEGRRPLEGDIDFWLGILWNRPLVRRRLCVFPAQVVSSRLSGFPLGLLALQPLGHLGDQLFRGAVDAVGMVGTRALLLLALLGRQFAR